MNVGVWWLTCDCACCALNTRARLLRTCGKRSLPRDLHVCERYICVVRIALRLTVPISFVKCIAPYRRRCEEVSLSRLFEA